VACLVNHSYEEGVFVLQVPISEVGENTRGLLDAGDKSQVLQALGSSLGVEARDIE
jgi:hypothetical protein